MKSQFDFYRKRMSVVVQHENQQLLICKGAPEEILKTNSQDDTFNARALKTI
ncbi:MAG: hypothetical protein WDO19_26680 [Bacteroidota bacterium]